MNEILIEINRIDSIAKTTQALALTLEYVY